MSIYSTDKAFAALKPDPTDIPTLEPTMLTVVPTTAEPSQEPTTLNVPPTEGPSLFELRCGDVKDWRWKKQYETEDIGKLGFEVFKAIQQNEKEKPNRLSSSQYWTFLGTCTSNCPGASEWRPYTRYERGDEVTDKQKDCLYKALKKSKGKRQKPGTEGQNYWEQIATC